MTGVIRVFVSPRVSPLWDVLLGGMSIKHGGAQSVVGQSRPVTASLRIQGVAAQSIRTGDCTALTTAHDFLEASMHKEHMAAASDPKLGYEMLSIKMGA